MTTTKNEPDLRLGESSEEDLSSIRLFDRRPFHPYPWVKSFGKSGATRDPLRRWAVAVNWRMDHRVSEAREASDLGSSEHFDEDWWMGRARYFRAEICQSSEPSPGNKLSAYRRPTNGSNLVLDNAAFFDRLVHVASLNAILRRLSRDSTRFSDFNLDLQERIGRALPDSVDIDRQAQGLAHRLYGQEELIRRLVGLVTEALGGTAPPWWACFAQEAWASIESENVANLCSILGLGHFRSGEWVLVWIYPVSEVAPLYRPTVLEANDSPFHFPSPPNYNLGITMPLNTAGAACREVIHRPLRGASAERWCTGKLFQLENFTPLDDNQLAALRSRHRQRLRLALPEDGVGAWLDRHPEPI